MNEGPMEDAIETQNQLSSLLTSSPIPRSSPSNCALQPHGGDAFLRKKWCRDWMFHCSGKWSGGGQTNFTSTCKGHRHLSVWLSRLLSLPLSPLHSLTRPEQNSHCLRAPPSSPSSTLFHPLLLSPQLLLLQLCRRSRDRGRNRRFAFERVELFLWF